MNSFEVLEKIIRKRESLKPALMNGKKIADQEIVKLLQLADWAPTHGHTEPWRFVVFSGEAVQRFCSDHAGLYKNNIAPENFILATFEKLQHAGDLVSHIIAVYMKKGVNPKIPAIEEIAATACAVQNILLGAHSLGISVLWNTGGMTHHKSMKNYFGLAEQDQMIGLLYAGYTDHPPKERKRIMPVEQKYKWIR